MMHTDQHKKICWNCDEELFQYQEKCPYCNVSLTDRESEVEESLTELYRPPYSMRFQEPEREYSYQKPQKPLQPSEKKGSYELWSLLFLSCGAGLLTLGLLIFFFAENGFFTLRWRSSSWALFTLSSLPFLVMGYKILRKLRH